MSRNSIVSMPAVPAPIGRSTAPIADRTPSMASVLVSMLPDVISASTTAMRHGSNTTKISGASVAVGEPARGVHEQTATRTSPSR